MNTKLEVKGSLCPQHVHNNLLPEEHKITKNDTLHINTNIHKIDTIIP